MTLPYLTPDVPPVRAQFRVELDDFDVEEQAAYEPSGTGDHTFVFLEKRDVSTPEAVKRLCAALGLDARDAGWAGLKDRRAVTRQWVSLFGVEDAQLKELELEGLRILEFARHPHKLRTGHLKGNRFRIRLRDIEPSGIDRVRSVLSHIEKVGLPNYYGEQRFGRSGDNAERALAWVTGERSPPRKPFERKLGMSALQSELFNRCVADRVSHGALDHVFHGDVMKRRETGGLFVADDQDEAQSRTDSGEIGPTGPIFGAKMKWPEHEAKQREEALLRDSGLTLEHLGRWKRIAPGTRRFVRVLVPEIGVTVRENTASLDFSLPAGSYATIVIREILKGDASSPKTS